MARAVKSMVDYMGTGGIMVEVECHITNCLPAIVIIGDASKAVDEAKERLRASFSNCQIKLPKKRVAINLSPADIPKDSTSLDLPMAVAIMVQDKQIKADEAEPYLFLGELGLEGQLNPVRGLIGRILAAKAKGQIKFYIPRSNLDQALLVPDITIKAAACLRSSPISPTNIRLNICFTSVIIES
jgi:magnesium chelatase family protein